MYLSPYAQTFAAEIVIVTHWLLLFVCYSTALDSTDISTLGKGKALVSTSGVEAYNKEILDDEIRRLITANVQLMTDKMETEKIKVNLETDRIRLFGEKNSPVVCHNPCRDKRTSANRPRLMVEPRNKGLIPIGSNRSSSIHSRQDYKEQIRSTEEASDWTAYFLYS